MRARSFVCLCALVGATVVVSGSANAPAARTPCRSRSLLFIDAKTGAVERGVSAANNQVNAAVTDGHGGWYAGGGFGFVGGVPRRTIEHFDASGRLDSRFRVRTAGGGQVFVLTRQSSVLYAAGHFGVAAFDAASGNLIWSTPANTGGGVGVSGLAVGSGALYVVGTFTRIGDASRDGVAALGLRTGRPLGWSVSVEPHGSTNALTVAVAANTVFLGGQFERLGAIPRANVGAVDARTGRVTSWKPARRPADYVEGMLVTHGEVLAGGHGGWAAFDSRTGRALGWTSKIHGSVTRFAVLGNTVYLGGNVQDGFMSVGNRLANNLAAVRLPGGRLTSWTPRVNRYMVVQALAASPHTVLAGGFFSQNLSC